MLIFYLGIGSSDWKVLTMILKEENFRKNVVPVNIEFIFYQVEMSGRGDTTAMYNGLCTMG